MDNKKSTKSKESQQQHNVLTSVLAQFDIETQVNKMVMRSFDSLMRTNKQAFDFIKQSEHKFIDFQQRLSKAQTYYQNIQLSVNSKIQVTESMNRRLSQFSEQFWRLIKQSNIQVTTMTKKYDQVLLEKRQLQGRIAQCQKEITRIDRYAGIISQKLNHQVLTLLSLIKQSQQKTDAKFLTESKQIRQISQNIIQSRSLLESKSHILGELLTDFELYKNDRPSIRVQLQQIFCELQNRAMKSDVIETRGYVDSKIIEEKQATNKLWLRMDTQIKVQERDRKRDYERVSSLVGEVNESLAESISNLNEEIKLKFMSVQQTVDKNHSIAELKMSQLSVDLSTLRAAYDKQVPQIVTKLTQTQLKLSQLAERQKHSSDQINELFSNIQSINQLIDKVMKENKQRQEQMDNLIGGENNKGNIEQRVGLLYEKVEKLVKQFTEVKSNHLQKIVKDVNKIQRLVQKNQSQSKKQLNLILKQAQSNYSQLTQTIKHNKQQTNRTLMSKTKQIQQKLQLYSRHTQNLIGEKLTSIQEKLQGLQAINLQIKSFKQQFQAQLIENSKVNESIGEKMERLMGLFTKIKSDFTVQIGQITIEMQKNSKDIKANISDLQQIKSYLSVVNEGINLLLVGSVFNFSGSHFSNGLSGGNLQSISNMTTRDMSSQLNTINHSNTITQHTSNPTSKHHQQPQSLSSIVNSTSTKTPIKITSLIQGWILETDETLQKVKYRGENFTFSNRIKFLLYFLQYFVKKTEKLKGSILQNGRDIFTKIIESKQETGKQRKRATSRKRRPSQLLPKLNM